VIVISVIIGSTREGRYSEKPARWILQHLRKRDGVKARLLDLRDFPMPFFDQATPPAMPGRLPHEHEVVKKLTAEIAHAAYSNFAKLPLSCSSLRCAPRSTSQSPSSGRTSRAAMSTPGSLSSPDPPGH
jgi:hypothetical protein